MHEERLLSPEELAEMLETVRLRCGADSAMYLREHIAIQQRVIGSARALVEKWRQLAEATDKEWDIEVWADCADELAAAVKGEGVIHG